MESALLINRPFGLFKLERLIFAFCTNHSKAIDQFLQPKTLNLVINTQVE